MTPRNPEAELGQVIDRAQRTLFRLETLDRYDVGSDGGDFARYIAGESGPDAERVAAWHQVLQADLARGVRTRRVHVVRTPLSDYLRFEFEWGHRLNLAYEDIRVLDLAETDAPDGLAAVGDFWVIDDGDVALMHYDDNGRFQGFEMLPGGAVRQALAVRDAAWAASVPFGRWWDDHRQFWRDGRRAA